MPWQQTPRPNPSGVVPLEGRKRDFHTPLEAVSRPSVFTCGTVCGNIELPEQEARDVGIFLDDLVDGATAGVSGLRVVEKRDRTVRAGGGLQPRRELRVRTMPRFLWERDERTKPAGSLRARFPPLAIRQEDSITEQPAEESASIVESPRQIGSAKTKKSG